MRTNMTTAIFNAETLVRNSLGNIAAYASARPLPASPNFGVLDLKEKAKGKAAIVVSAGPSLAKNVHCLLAHGIRERFVVIAVQTVLKPLLARGIRPHFVCALDYHKLSMQFYEGLTFDDVEGVHLVCQQEAYPGIAEAWPGVLRMPGGDPLVDETIGEPLTEKMGTLPRGCTVAHMGYYLARYMGCDPVIHVGQDLAYTDGVYYGAGAAIHDQWACELNGFRSLEMFEHERIVRAKGSYKAIPAQGGGTVYSDALLITYLDQFKAIWAQDIANGLRVIDATEGGADKAPATPMPLDEAMRRFGPEPPLSEKRRLSLCSLSKRRLLDTAGKAL